MLSALDFEYVTPITPKGVVLEGREPPLSVYKHAYEVAGDISLGATSKVYQVAGDLFYYVDAKHNSSSTILPDTTQ